MIVNKKSIIHRYSLFTLIFFLLGIAIVAKTAIIMFAERDYWHKVADRLKKENVAIPANRGNILSGDGRLMASSLPEYKIYMDFQAGGEEKDTMLVNHMDELADGLHRVIPDMSKQEFMRRLQNGRSQQSRYFLLYPGKISYLQLKECQKLPVLSLGAYRGGFVYTELNQRKKPFGTLAARTLGDMFPDKSQGAKNGLELSFDTLLCGKDGITHRQKVRNKFLNIVDIPPIDGCDLMTTIDIDMQDIAEKALVDKLKELNAMVGVVVLMEVKTGDVKAIVNMTRGKDGQYYEMKNNAISDMLEPGSTFKTASIMVALEDGYITPETEVETGNGVKMMHGSWMKDHNWAKGGYGRITVSRVLEVSSNIGVSSIIDKYYGKNPQRFVDGLKRMSIDQPLHLQIAGEGKPNIRGPKERYFSKTTIPWMSIGYETQLPPINILTFYNAIANNGVMVRPNFVKSAVKDGEVVKQFDTRIINPKICSDRTLAQIQEILKRVVSVGLGKAAGSKQFAVAGKTGTAQISQGKAGYKNGGRRYLVSFCGYFPADNPKYSMIVSIQKPGLPASGGLMAGSVFSKIAERVYAKNLRYDLEALVDSTTNVIPDVKAGDLHQTYEVLRAIQVPVKAPALSATAWGTAQKDSSAVKLMMADYSKNLVPNVIGMGAKDAVYLLEKKGLRVNLIGAGKVRQQSIPGGHKFAKGQTISIRLD